MLPLAGVFRSLCVGASSCLCVCCLRAHGYKDRTWPISCRGHALPSELLSPPASLPLFSFFSPLSSFLGLWLPLVVFGCVGFCVVLACFGVGGCRLAGFFCCFVGLASLPPLFPPFSFLRLLCWGFVWFLRVLVLAVAVRLGSSVSLLGWLLPPLPFPPLPSRFLVFFAGFLCGSCVFWCWLLPFGRVLSLLCWVGLSLVPPSLFLSPSCPPFYPQC